MIMRIIMTLSFFLSKFSLCNLAAWEMEVRVMPRKARICLENCYYFHVMSQGINRSYIFEETKDKEFYRKIFKEKEGDYDLEIITSCIMDNHVHFVIYTKKIEVLSSFMKKINLNYAMYYNRTHDRVGYVFRDRFKSQGIFSEKQLYNCIKYVFNNPVKAGLCANPKEYPYLDYKKEMCNNIDDWESDESFIDIEDEEVSDESVICEYINKNQLRIKENADDLKCLVKYLKGINMSFRRMEKVINVSREKLRKLCQ